MRKFPWIHVAIAVVVVAAFVGIEMRDMATRPPTRDETVKSVPLVGEGGETTTLAALRGSWLVVFFGYMTCPDYCPTTLAYLAKEIPKSGLPAGKVKGVFVSVDPGRDKPEALKKYVEYFGDGFVALTGTEERLRELTKAVGAHFEYGVREASGAYTVAHSTSLFIFGPDGSLVKTLSQPFAAGAVALALRDLAKTSSVD